jgi:hypothetical protein
MPLGHRATSTQAELLAQTVILFRQLGDLNQRRIEPHPQLDRIIPLRPHAHASILRGAD